MARATILTWFLVLACVHANSVNANCPPDQEYKSRGTACDARCGRSAPANCPQKCARGCQGVKGYVRDAANRCVPPNMC